MPGSLRKGIRRNKIHFDISLADFHREGPCETDQGKLAGSIRDMILLSEQTGGRGREHDSSIIRLEEPRESFQDRVDGTPEIEIHVLAEFVERRFDDRLFYITPGIGDDDVQSPKGGKSGLDHGAAAFLAIHRMMIGHGMASR